MTYFDKFGDTLPISMLNSHQVSCARCRKPIRLTASQTDRGIDKCRPCYRIVSGKSRPIPGREKVKRVHVRHSKPVQPAQPKKKGKRKGEQEATD